MRTVNRHWKVQRELQEWKAKVLQLQQVQTYDKGMPSKEEGTRNDNMLQV